VAVTTHEERPVFEIPAIRIEVTAHRAEVKTCPGCGRENHGLFPGGVSGPVQYGLGVKTWATYFQTQHFVPVERTAQILEDLVSHRVAEATLMKAQRWIPSRPIPPSPFQTRVAPWRLEGYVDSFTNLQTMARPIGGFIICVVRKPAWNRSLLHFFRHQPIADA
jgi:transposase